MIIHMARTTLILDEQRLIEVKRLAAKQRRTLSSVVDEFLRDGLMRAQTSSRKKKPFTLPIFDMGRPKANLADRDQLYDILDGR
jgi:hypothetical protein